MVGTGRSIFEGGKERGDRCGIGKRVGDRRGGGNAPRNDDGAGMRDGVRSRKLT